jgi:hypothetical protein
MGRSLSDSTIMRNLRRARAKSQVLTMCMRTKPPLVRYTDFVDIGQFVYLKLKA